MVNWRVNPLSRVPFLQRFAKTDSGCPRADAFFRANVGAMVFNRSDRVLVLRRKDVETPTWQLPQGGLHRGEGPRAALEREIGEETGLGPDDYTILAEYPRWLAYELPEAFQSPRLGLGQVQKWFVCRQIDDLAVVRPDQVEFDAFRWVSLDEMVVHAADFRRSIYEQLAAFAADIVKHSVLVNH